MPCAFVAALVFIYALLPAPKVDSGPPLPSPNGYDDFVKAGLSMISSDYTLMTKEELKACLSTNQASLRLARIGLTRECQVPTEDSADYTRTHIPAVVGVQQLQKLFSTEGLLAELEERYVDATRSHLDNIRFGQLSANAGLVLDKILGDTTENIGMFGLEGLVAKLDARQAREVIASLAERDARTTPASVFITREREWSRKAGRWMHRIDAMWKHKTLFPMRQTEQTLTVRIEATDRRRRQLILNLAARAYELEHGKRPVRAEDLVPSILSAIPKDPETGTNLVLIPAP